MEKLQLQHIAAYLPYDVKRYVDFKDEETGDVLYIPVDDLSLKNIHLQLMNNIHGLIALRPLSDFGSPGYTPEKFNKEYSHFLNTYIARGSIEYYKTMAKFNHTMWPRGLVEIFIKYHFDVFGLIEKGLAIDINSIQNV